MPNPQRVTNQQVIDAYRSTGSVWKAAKLLGIIGQSVWERLTRLDVQLPSSKWTDEELAELRALASTCTIGEIARRLGRPYYGVAIKISRLGLGSRVGNRRVQTKRAGISKRAASEFQKMLPGFTGSLKQFARLHGVSLDMLVYGLQKHAPERWEELSRARGLVSKSCPNCDREFYPMTARQQTCSRICDGARRRDQKYFGGRRNETIGLAEGICQLCERHTAKGLSSHHVFGKENDPENGCLIALCRGCHQMVGRLGRLVQVVDSPGRWESLIALALMRRHGGKEGRRAMHVTVEWDWLTDEELQESEEAHVG